MKSLLLHGHRYGQGLTVIQPELCSQQRELLTAERYSCKELGQSPFLAVQGEQCQPHGKSQSLLLAHRPGSINVAGSRVGQGTPSTAMKEASARGS